MCFVTTIRDVSIIFLFIFISTIMNSKKILTFFDFVSKNYKKLKKSLQTYGINYIFAES